MKHTIKTLPSTLIAVLLWVLPALSSAQPMDDAAQAPQVVTMSEAVTWALQRHPTFARDSAELAAREASVRAAFGQFLPSISLRGGYVKYLNDVGTVTGGLELESSRPSTELTGGASASIQLFDGFSRSASYNAAGHERDAAALTYVAHQADVAYEVRASFLELLSGEATIEARRTALATLRKQLERLEGRIEAGVALPLDRDALEAEIAMAEYDLLVAENSRESLLASLISTLNFDPARRIEVSSSGVPIDLDRPEIDAHLEVLGNEEEIVAVLLERRSDIAALRSTLLAADERVTVATSGRYPTIGASIGVNHYRSGPIDQTTSTLGIDLQYLLFDRFQTDEAIARAETALLNARLDLRQRELDVRAEISASRLRLDGATRLLSASRTSVDAARRSRESALARYEEGVGGYSDVLTATSRFVEARINAISAAYDWWSAYYDVVRVQGSVYP